MDKYEFRRQRLEALKNKHCFGKIAILAEKINKDPSYVSRMFYPKDKPGHKRIGEDMVEVINKAFPGWLDTDGSQKVIELPAKTALPAPLGELVQVAGKLSYGGQRELLGYAKRMALEEHESKANPAKS